MGPSKIQVYKTLLKRYPSLFIHINTKSEFLDLPEKLFSSDSCILQIGLNMAIPIPDLVDDTFGIYCTLSFKGVPHTCSIPWESIYAIIGEDGKGKVWQEDMPASVKAEFQAKTAPKKEPLKLIRGDGMSEGKFGDNRPKLRLVK